MIVHKTQNIFTPKVIAFHHTMGAFLGRHKAAQKPGFPLQVLGFANANPVGFPLQSHCARTSGNQKEI
jgi:hypothetical protein